MRNDSPLIDTSWLQDHLHDADMKIFDVSLYLRFPEGTGAPPVIESGRDSWEKAHIPGAHFIDLANEFSEPDSPTAFTMIASEEFCDKMAAHGVGDDSMVVVYSGSLLMWATRLWWMFRSVGFDNCRVLDGGFGKWVSEDRPTSSTRTKGKSERRKLTPQPRPDLWATKQEVMESIGNPGICSVNALPPDVYSGERNSYGRPGHIPGSINIFQESLIDPEAQTFLPKESLRQAIMPTGALDKDRVICYCGGGISATVDALALHVLGHRNIAIYDGSMVEWAKDEAAPLELGAKP